jgi:microcystin-dependent protein
LAPNDSAGPDLTQRFLGEAAAQETVTLVSQQIPGTRTRPTAIPTWARLTTRQAMSGQWIAGRNNEYGSRVVAGQMSQAAISPTGGGQPYTNIQPYVALNFCIALAGIFPARS